MTEPSVIFKVVTEFVANEGLGYVPFKTPPAFPLGGNEVGKTPLASLEIVTDASAIFEVITEEAVNP